MPIPDCLWFWGWFVCLFPSPLSSFLIKGERKWADCPAWGAIPNSWCGFRSEGEKARVNECLERERASKHLGEKPVSLHSANKMEALAKAECLIR